MDAVLLEGRDRGIVSLAHPIGARHGAGWTVLRTAALAVASDIVRSAVAWAAEPALCSARCRVHRVVVGVARTDGRGSPVD